MMYDRFVNERTRLVCATEDINLIGCKVVEKYTTNVSHDRVVVYNAWKQLCGETIMYSEVMYGLIALEKDGNMDCFLERTRLWLSKSKRIREIKSGQAVLYVWYVELKEDGSIGKVLNV